MDAVDPRTRHKVSLNPQTTGSRVAPFPWVILPDALLVLALHAGKTYLLSADISLFWVLVRVLACGAVGLLVWATVGGQLRRKRIIEWSVLGTSSLLLFLKHAGLLTALYRLPTTRVVVVTRFSLLWFRHLLSPASLLQTCVIVLALFVAAISDASLSSESFRQVLPAYGALLLEAVASGALDHTQSVLLPSLGEPLTLALSTCGAFVFSLPLYMLRHVMIDVPSASHAVSFGTLAVLAFLAYTLLFQAPKASRLFQSPTLPPQYVIGSYIASLLTSVALGILVYGKYPRLTDLIVGSLLLYGVYPRLITSVSVSPYASSSRLVRSYLKTILSNPESRKIFYFLVLNMCYMLVQMVYGVWTNSLGLISDAIHMAFDCMAIGVGLIASVMARWPPNERFTYGYGRIETLSGFANGIFLILISVFIVFEAIQRLLEPPEMNTSQLLLVSSLGLGVNLFGMFAMGGHHHGGHSHSHGHSHGHAHGPSPPTSPALDHDHHADHSHSHAENHHDHSHDAPELHSHSHSHSEHSHSHSHDHDHLPSSPVVSSSPAHHSHSHDSEPAILIENVDSEPVLESSSHTGHTHSHDHDHSHSHSHSHSRTSTHDEAHSNELLVTIPKRLLVTDSPLTPNYKFGHDVHYETHHSSAHGPNLHDHSHVHDHAHEGHSHNMRGVFLHVMADTLGSVGVIVSTLLIQWYGWTGFDPIASLFIAVLIAASVIPLVIDTGKVLALDLSDREARIRDTLSELRSIEGLASYNSARFWPKDDSSIIGSIHIQLAPSHSSYDPTGPHSSRKVIYTNVERVIERVDKLLRSRISGLEELTIQVEGSPTGH